MDKRGLLTIGKIIKTHGIRGKLKVLSFLESIDHFFSIKELQIEGENDAINSFTVRSAGGHGNKAILELEGVDFFGAGELIGKMVWVRRDQLPPLEEGEYYWADLVGMRVYLKDGHSIGIIEQIFNFGSNDIYVCKDGNKEVLIPATEEVIDRVDLEGKRMVIQEVEGLF